MATITEALQIAVKHHQAGQLAQAEQIYRQVLSVDPKEPNALHLLGVIANQVGKPDVAIQYISAAIAINGGDSMYFNNLGEVYRSLGRSAEAESAYRKALELTPTHADAWNNLGILMQSKADFAGAEASYRRALELRPNFPTVLNNLSVALKQQGQAAEAAQLLDEALRLMPDFIDALVNRGVLYADENRLEQAEKCYRKVLALDPSNSKAQNNLGAMLNNQGREVEAAKCYQIALKSDPKNYGAAFNLGVIYKRRLQLSDAERLLRRALELRPNEVEALNQLTYVLISDGQYEEALATLDRLIALDPQPGHRIKRALVVPVIFDSPEQLEASRERVRTEVAKLAAADFHIDDPLTSIGMTSFFLAYHGQNDRELLSDIARMIAKIGPSLEYVAPHCLGAAKTPGKRPIKIGMISRFWYRHPIGKVYCGIIERLNRQNVSVVLFRFTAPEDQEAERINQAADKVVLLPSSISAARELIAKEELDLLFYTDLGMDPWTYFLAFARLAPVQCVTGGHPDTSGIPAIDYFISQADLEPADGDDHYSERLVRMEQPAVYYSRPKRGAMRDRQFFGWQEDERIYLCPQALFKVHPDFDRLVGEILRSDERGRVVFFNGLHPAWAEQLRRRINRSIPDVATRVTFQPRQPFDDFIEALTLADAILDTTCFNGGTTSMDALALGLPIVTLPGRFMRGRQTRALYCLLGVMDLVAANEREYVELALRLAQDRAWRESIGARLLAAGDRLFDRRDGTLELERFFLRAVDELRQSRSSG